MDEELEMRKRVCQNCGEVFDKDEMTWTRDCHGIVFRHVCWNCFGILMEKGFDGEEYSEFDECIDFDY